MFQHACFISYRHPDLRNAPPSQTHFWPTFVTEFQRQLEQYITVPIRSYMDARLRSQPGIDYPIELSQRLCGSVCLVAIIVPEYWESPWCVSEWQAMERFEQARLGRAGLIIPVVIRGNRTAIERRVRPRQTIDFYNVTKPTQLRNVGNLRKIEAIANMINQHARRLAQLSPECERFEIELVTEVRPMVEDDPDPFAE